MRGGGRSSLRVPGNVEEPRGAPRGKTCSCPPGASSQTRDGTGGEGGSIVPVLPRQSRGLPAKCCYHLLALSKSTSIRGSLASPAPALRITLSFASRLSSPFIQGPFIRTSCKWAGQNWYSRSLQKRRKIVKEVCEPTSTIGRTMKLFRTHLGETGFNELGE